MNYYSIEFFKHYLLKLKKNKINSQSSEIINKMLEYVKDREENNKSAYNKKWMKKPSFQD